jgi:hypothetical protein
MADHLEDRRPRRGRRAIAARAAMAIAALQAVGSVAVGYPVPWPHHTLRVYFQPSAATERETVLTAMEKWNEADVGERFAVVSRPAGADVVVAETTEHGARSACHMFPWVPPIQACVDWSGWKPWGQTRLEIVSPDSPDGDFNEMTAAHELGHVLGLSHAASPSRGPDCEIMDPQANCSANDRMQTSRERCARGVCVQQVTRSWVCGPEPLDVLLARAIYGGPGNRRYNPDCTYSVQLRFAQSDLIAGGSSDPVPGIS